MAERGGGDARAERPIDGEKLGEFARTIFGALEGAMTSTMIYLGDRLGLYRELATLVDADSRELASRLGLSERWVREWLHQQGAAGVLEHRGDDRFALSPEGEAILSNERHPAFGAGFFSSLPRTIAVAERLPESFRSGVGLPYDVFGAEGAVGIERGFAPWFRTLLVGQALPRVEGLCAMLEAGAVVADVGCGSGVALLEMARAYPQSRFRGYELSKHALERANENAAAAGLSNVRFHDVSEDPLPRDGELDFVTTFDCLHDMTNPATVIAEIRAALKPGGVWLISDIRSHGTYEENVSRNPMAAMMYGMSVMTCMSSALSEPEGAGLGTLGLHEALLREMVAEAGFGHCEVLDLDHPINEFYVVRP